jgi:RNA-directed DNA polymerase
LFTCQELDADQQSYLDAVRSGLREIPGAPRHQAISYAETLMRNGFPVLFDQAHLAWVTGVPAHLIGSMVKHPRQFYSSFRIPKRSGGSRPIDSPTPALMSVQSWIKEEITSRFHVHPTCHGFVPGRSIISNASPHVGQSAILKLDIVDFFGTVSRRSVYRLFRRIGYSKQMANLLATLTTFHGSLPQGAPTSPELANIAAFRLDLRLSGFCKRRKIHYTRYADDLTFSGQAVIARSSKRTIEAIMRAEFFTPHESKARYLLPSERQAVTGIVVNEKANWPRDRRRWLRQEVYFLHKFGVVEHLRRREVSASRYKEFIYGHVYALNAVRPDEAARLLAQLDQVSWAY